MNKPNKQVGGSHYELPIQPIEYIEANSIPYHEANVIKYITRWRNKNGVQDLLKCHWYLTRLIELEYNESPDDEKKVIHETLRKVFGDEALGRFSEK